MTRLLGALLIYLLLCPAAAYAQHAISAPLAQAPVAGSPQAVPNKSAALVQTQAMAAQQQPGGATAIPMQMAELTPEELNRPFKGSFFLSPLEIAAIQQAMSGKVLKNQTLVEDSKPIPPHRVIRISGVLYRAPEDWVVWMNNHKVTPDDLLPEIVDISVRDSSKVSLKWYDIGLNQVISITLRPHQTYDITTGILLPGTH